MARLLAEGASVVGVDVAPPREPLDVPDGADLASFAPADVRDEERRSRRWSPSIVEAHGRLDAVVTAAGVAGGGAGRTSLPSEEWQRVLDVNLTGTFLVCKHAIAQMLTQEPVDDERGSIVTIASVEGLEGTAGGSSYNASKGGVVLLTRNLAIDYGRQGIRANAICPGFIETPMLEGVFGMPGLETVRDDIRHEHKLAASAAPRRSPRSRASCSRATRRSSPGRPSRSTAATPPGVTTASRTCSA